LFIFNNLKNISPYQTHAYRKESRQAFAFFLFSRAGFARMNPTQDPEHK